MRAVQRDRNRRVGQRFAKATVRAEFLTFVSLQSTGVSVRLKDVGEFPLDLFLCPKLEPFHSPNDLFIKFICPKGFTVDEMSIRRSIEPTDHPRVIENF